MIRTDVECAQTRRQLLGHRQRLQELEASMREAGLEAELLKRVMDPLRCAMLRLQEDLESYERMRRGSFDPIENVERLGRLLIAARVFAGLSQRDLAKRLDVHESQISRDERNEYRGITVERASRILEAVGEVELVSTMRQKFS